MPAALRESTWAQQQHQHDLANMLMLNGKNILHVHHQYLLGFNIKRHKMSMSVDKTDDKMMLKLLTNNANHVSNFLILLSDCVHF